MRHVSSSTFKSHYLLLHTLIILCRVHNPLPAAYKTLTAILKSYVLRTMTSMQQEPKSWLLAYGTVRHLENCTSATQALVLKVWLA